MSDTRRAVPGRRRGVVVDVLFFYGGVTRLVPAATRRVPDPVLFRGRELPEVRVGRGTAAIRLAPL
jgi:hypothetical protein